MNVKKLLRQEKCSLFLHKFYYNNERYFNKHDIYTKDQIITAVCVTVGMSIRQSEIELTKKQTYAILNFFIKQEIKSFKKKLKQDIRNAKMLRRERLNS